MGEGRQRIEERDHLEAGGVDRRTGSECILGRYAVCVCVCVKSIHLAQDRDRWRALVNAVINLRVLQPRRVTLIKRNLN
jgi:hypothetical protein